MGRRWAIAVGAIVASLVAITMADPLAFVADDSWFYLVIGRNVAGGHGITFNRAMPTNGFQPLWQAVVALVVTATRALGLRSPEAEVRAVLAVAGALLGAALWATQRLLRRLGVPPVGVGVALAASAVLFGGVLGTIGSEANVLALFLVLSLLALLDVLDDLDGGLAAPARLGGLLGLVVLSRLDSGFVAVAALVAIVVLGQGSIRRRARAAVVAGAAALAVVGPYLAWNLVRFGHLLPIAGAIKLDRSTFVANPDAVGLLGWGALAAGAVLAALAWAGRRPARAEAAAFGVPYAGALVSTAIYFAWAPGRFTDLDWYKVPHLLALTVAGALVVRRVADRAPKPVALLAPAAVGLLVVAGLFVAVDRRMQGANHRFWHPVATFSEAVGRDVPEGELVASVDFPGVLAMYSGRDVVALDGLTGDYEFQDDLRDAGGPCTLHRLGVRYLVVDDADRLDPVPGTEGDFTVVTSSWLHHVDTGRLRLHAADLVRSDERAGLSLWRIDPRC